MSAAVCTLTYLPDGAQQPVTLTGTENGDVQLLVADTGERRTVTLTARRPVRLLDYRESGLPFLPAQGEADDLYFMNGYQSWTDTREVFRTETERNVYALPRPVVDRFALDRYGDASFYPYDKRFLHGYDVFYVKGRGGVFLFSLNRRFAYLVVSLERAGGRVTLISDAAGACLGAGDSFVLCDYVYRPSYEEGLRAFYDCFPKRPVKKLFGYTSWYNYYQKIDQSILLRDLDALDGRFDLFQIDDGYETFVGDWLDVDPAKFPDGLAPLVERIHGKGLLAGIWLAPFVAEAKSRLFAEKPGWFCADEAGRPVRCGSNWSGFYALDLENEEVRAYIRQCLTHYAQMGFDFFKLDFLYAANLPRYPGKTRCQAAEEAYALLRDMLGDKLILGCGATLWNAAGRFDYLRVGPDVSLRFDDVWYMRRMHRERISTRVTLQNTVYRSFMDGALFGNDPDVFLLREENLHLSPAQKQALITLNALFGSVMMTSDNLAEYAPAQQAALARALDLFARARVTGFARRGRMLAVTYTLDGKECSLTYDTKRGVLL
ncbi:MAG: alpha-galactosidase [Clostridia bacterium]|nr:alpha-galactosidase [Clostridia bacterium]